MRGLIVDNFAGGGGASTGMEQALGRPVDIAINHDREALAMHEANHPETRHYAEDVFKVDPDEVTAGRPVWMAWFSPDCKHFSKANGGKPKSKKIRALAWVMVKWAAKVRPLVMFLENVEEFQTWGPLLDDGKICQARKGMTFRNFVAQLRNLGYTVESRVLKACDYGAPTIRKRLFLVARCDGLPIVWPAPTHGAPNSPEVLSGARQPWRTAAECIDWSIPCRSIFERKRPLAEATMRRIARGIRKFVIESPNPFIVPLTHPKDVRVHSIDEPLRTVTGAQRGELALIAPHITKFREGQIGSSCDEPLHTVTAGGEQQRPGTGNAMGLVAATLVQTGYGERDGQQPRAPGLEKPLGTVVGGGGKHAAVAAFLAKHYGGHESPGASAEKPFDTIKAKDHHAVVTAQIVGCGGRAAQSRPRSVSEPAQTLTAKADSCVVTSNLAKLYGTTTGHDVREPLHTITSGGNHIAEVRAFLIRYYGIGSNAASLREPIHTLTAKDRIGLVTIHGEEYVITDIGMRMLEPHELYAAQGFPADYIIAPVVNGRRLPKHAQVRMCGNSAPPPLVKALVEANAPNEFKLSEEEAA